MIKREKYADLLKDPRFQLKYQPGMSLAYNSNGNIDSATLGYQYSIQTTSLIRARTVEQQFYEVPPAEFVDVIVGEGAWMEEIKTNLVYQLAGDFESGITGISDDSQDIGAVTVGVAPVAAKIVTWQKGYKYSNVELEKALRSDNWDVVSDKLKALKKHWDLGIQKVAFLGLKSDPTAVPGLLTNPNVNINTTIITADISSLTAAQLSTLISLLVADYYANSNYTKLPNRFVMPASDFLGMGVPYSSSFPNISMLEYMLRMFRQITKNPDFQIEPLSYSDATNNAGYVSTSGKYRYVLYHKNEETLSMDIPVDLILTPAGTANNFNWQGVGVGQFTGTIIYRPAEVRYYDHS